MDSKTLTRHLPVLLTIPEKLDYGSRLAELHQQYANVESQKAIAAATYKETLIELDGRIAHLARVLRDGHESRAVDCTWRYLFASNQKELVRIDTGEVVETAAITAEERQLLLELEVSSVEPSTLKRAVGGGTV